jgi:hypothetical protein
VVVAVVVDERQQAAHRCELRHAGAEFADVALDRVEQRQPVAAGLVADVVDESGEHVRATQVFADLPGEGTQCDREVLGGDLRGAEGGDPVELAHE